MSHNESVTTRVKRINGFSGTLESGIFIHNGSFAEFVDAKIAEHVPVGIDIDAVHLRWNKFMERHV